MDPNETLTVIRQMICCLNDSEITDKMDSVDLEPELFKLAGLVENLDKWISRGGFLPRDWQKPVDCIGGK